MRGYSLCWALHEGDDYRESTEMFGYHNSNKWEERSLMTKYLTAICKSCGNKVPPVFSAQHKGQLPTSLQRSTAKFISTLTIDIPDIVPEFLKLMSNHIGEEEGQNVYDVARGFVENALREMFPGESYEPAFVAQCFLLDVQSVLCFPALEKIYVSGDVIAEYSTTEDGFVIQETDVPGEWLDEEEPTDEACDDAGDEEPNAFSFAAHCGPGCEQFLRFVNEATGRTGRRNKVTLSELWPLFLDIMRNLSADELLTFGIRSVWFRSHRVLFNALMGKLCCPLFFEHMCCKVYVLLKQKFPQYCHSKVLKTDKPHCHPIVLGGSRDNPRLFDYEHEIPGFLPAVYSYATSICNSMRILDRESVLYERLLAPTGRPQHPLTFSVHQLPCLSEEGNNKELPFSSIELFRSAKDNGINIYGRRVRVGRGGDSDEVLAVKNTKVPCSRWIWSREAFDTEEDIVRDTFDTEEDIDEASVSDFEYPSASDTSSAAREFKRRRIDQQSQSGLASQSEDSD